MKMTNQEIAQIFEDVADLLEIKGEIIHRVLAYRNAAETLRDLPRDLNKMVAAQEDLTQLPHIGATLAEKITEMLTTGQLNFYQRLSAEIPSSLIQIMRINGVGPKKAKLFWQELGITTLEGLKTAAENQHLRSLKGMGEKSEQKILEGITALAKGTDRILLGKALPLAQLLLEDLLTVPGALQGQVAGSVRRFRPTIGDIDILIAAENAAPIMERLVANPSTARVLGQGPTKSSVELAQGLQVDVRVLPPARYGTALSYFTGSQAHNIRLRQLALDQGLSLNEHAVTRADGSEILCATEEEVYAVLGLPWIPPELREDRGEIEAAQAGKLPLLLTLADIRSDLHMHTTWSDGRHSVREMAEHARERGLTHIVITDHSRSLALANGLSIERLLEQQAEVRAVDAAMQGSIRVLHGTEMDINPDGSLDFPDEILAQLDVVIASLHLSLNQSRDQITQRALNAIANPHVDIIGHPRSQLIGKRQPTELDMEALFSAAAHYDTALEINANPERLDLEDTYARRAAEMGIKISINTDAHSLRGFEVLPFGVGTARRAWLTAEQVINTWPQDRLLEWIRG